MSNTNILENFWCLFNIKSIRNLKTLKNYVFLFNFKKFYCHEIVNFWIIYHWYYYLSILYPWKSMHRSKIVKKTTNFRQNPNNFQNSYVKFSEIFQFLKFHKGTTFGLTRTPYGTPFGLQISDFKTIGGTLWRNFFSKGVPFWIWKKVDMHFCPHMIPGDVEEFDDSPIITVILYTGSDLPSSRKKKTLSSADSTRSSEPSKA